MAAANGNHSYEGRPPASSPRFKGRDHARNTPCRNVTIYGYCRHEKDGCMYNHDTSKPRQAPPAQAESSRTAAARNLNVDSPSFTPATPATTNTTSGNNNGSPVAKKAGFSPKAAMTAAFVPRNTRQGYSSPRANNRSTSSQSRSANFNVQEFVPKNFIPQQEVHPPVALADPFNPYADASAYATLEASPPNPPINPYIGNDGASTNPAAFYQQGAHIAPPQYHLYAPIGPHRDNLLSYQRSAHDFFIAEDLRQDLQRKCDATLQVLMNTSLPPTVEHFHSLVPLDTNSNKTSQTYGYKTWVYKATSSKDGLAYVLRRLEGFRLTSEKTIQPVQIWKQIRNASVVTVHDCFTTRAFGDSSLVLVMDYHPLAKTLSEHNLQPLAARGPRLFVQYGREEDLLWGYLVQLASAIRCIHQRGLAARLVSPSKVLLTGKSRVRLNGCAVLDIVQADDPRAIEQLQIEDMQQLGRLMLGLASNTDLTTANAQLLTKSLATISTTYSVSFKDCIVTLIDNPPIIDTFLADIASRTIEVMDKALNLEDELTSNLSRELENGRMIRLMTKLGFVNERPEYNPHTAAQTIESMKWSETGERYYLKLFRDYVFHQVGQDGRPVLDLAHVVSCLNNLDAGSEEKIVLVTRDEQNVFVVSYKEVKRTLENAFLELVKAQGRA